MDHRSYSLSTREALRRGGGEGTEDGIRIADNDRTIEFCAGYPCHHVQPLRRQRRRRNITHLHPLEEQQQRRRQQQRQDCNSNDDENDCEDEEHEDEMLRHQLEQRRTIRQRRLVVRPVVILLLGFLVFRNNSSSSNWPSWNLFKASNTGERKAYSQDNVPMEHDTQQHDGLSADENHNNYYFSYKNIVGSHIGTGANTDHAPPRKKGGSSTTSRVGGHLPVAVSAKSSLVRSTGDKRGSDDRESDSPSTLPTNDEKKKSHRDNDTDNHSRNNNEDDTSSKNNEDNNPSAFGWVPEIYPDPGMDPVRCGIAYLTEKQLEHQGALMPATGAEAEEERRGGIVASKPKGNQTSDSAASQTNEIAGAGLRLCDPDWVLGGVYLERIAQKMQDFSDRFTTHSAPQGLYNNDEPHDGDDDEETRGERKREPGITLAVATVRKMNIHAVLREEQMFYAYGDDDDMVNDAAQIFARSLHNQWWRNRNNKNLKTDDSSDAGLSTDGEHTVQWHATGYSESSSSNNRDFGVLIFLSIQDRVCFISTGNAISTVLPWWRLEHIVASMKPDLRHRDYGNAVLTAIDDLSEMLEAGPPTFQDRMHDFLARFGVVIAFALFTFLFGAWGECRDRRKRWQYAELRSQLNSVEREKARLKQKVFQTKSCPICLETFDGEEDDNDYEQTVSTDEEASNKTRATHPSPSLKPIRRVDTYGIPLNGADRKKIKFLRCGHIFCESCWKNWVHSGHGNPCICPVCRQDVGKSSSKSKRRKEQRRAARRARAAAANGNVDGGLLGTSEQSTPHLSVPESNARGPGFDEHTFPSYGSLSSPGAVDTTLLTTSTDSLATTSTMAASLEDEEDVDTNGNPFLDRGARLLASAFGPIRSSRTMNRDRRGIQSPEQHLLSAENNNDASTGGRFQESFVSVDTPMESLSQEVEEDRVIQHHLQQHNDEEFGSPSEYSSLLRREDEEETEGGEFNTSNDPSLWFSIVSRENF